MRIACYGDAVRVRHLSPAEVAASLDFSVEALARSHPELSARQLFERRWRKVIVGIIVLIAVLLLLDPLTTAIGLLSVLVAVYVAVTVNRIVLFFKSQDKDALCRVSPEEARSTPDHQLPVYTVLVPAYQEPEVIGSLIRHLEALEYPRDKLDVKLLLEEDDDETVAAVHDANPPDYFELVLVPPAEPRTKPKALNFALAFAQGSVLTIYDAEDQPDPLQLRRAAFVLGRTDERIACVQAKLSFANSDQNMITRWFTLEYTMWFELFLPGLSALKAPIPLGGTSNHFRVDVLRSLGAWDPSNVTEDADLGIRLARHGYQCEVLDSTTLEEANSDFVNWVKQRSRWYKGYLQTAIVHLRRLRTSARELGPLGLVELVLFVLGTPVLALLNTVFWAMTAMWFAFHPQVIRELFPAPLFYPAVLSWVLGNFTIVYLHILTCRLLKRFDLTTAAVLVPMYWIMMALAAAKATWQLFAAPTFWEKTTHGLAQISIDTSTDGPKG